MAWDMMLLVSTLDTSQEVLNGKLVRLLPVKHRGIWVTRGCLRKGLFSVLGVEELPVLLPTSSLSYLVMRKAHEQEHTSPKSTLWHSRTKAWIV